MALKSIKEGFEMVKKLEELEKMEKAIGEARTEE